ncbi:MAG: RagB/SusD family nutrient uptake outer membrane protein [Sinomicrobium sp.]|nr:RagB/SusD family nutrient uptake outer membrane protein [Sinomicrobium sp.]
MKRIFVKTTICFFSILFLLSCEKEFLEEPKPTDSVTSEVIFGSRAGAEAFISGILRLMRAQYTATDTAGLNSIYYARTVKGNDIIQGPTWFSFDYENDNREPTYRRVNFTWQFCYDVINQTNTLINGIAESVALSDTDKAELSAQGRALRAFFYFQLAMEFTSTYAEDATAEAPPIYTELSLEGHPMSTLQEIYDRILDDLNFAVANLDDYRLDKSYVNQRVAYGMLAQVHQVMGNWAEAEQAANNAYGGDVNSALNAAGYTDGFSDINNMEWIWGSPQRDDQSNYYWGAPHAHADHFVLSYAATFFNNDFVAEFSPTDVRNMFLEHYAVPDTDYRNWITTKFTFSFDSDHPIMRAPEMILIEAEARYWQGDETEAHNLLFQLQSNRDPAAVMSANAGVDLLNEILLERRKELYAEIGVEWFDAKRLRRGITRTGNHRIGSEADLMPDDKNFYLKIPQSEIDANPNISESVNAYRD